MNVTVHIEYKTPQGEFKVIAIAEFPTVSAAFPLLGALQDITSIVSTQFRVMIFLRKGRDC